MITGRSIFTRIPLSSGVLPWIVVLLVVFLCGGASWHDAGAARSPESDGHRSGGESTRKALSGAAAEPPGPASTSGHAAEDQSGARDRGTIIHLKLDGAIFAGTADYLIAGVRAAEARGLPVLIELDTPGGELQATRDIVQSFLGARVPVIVWIGPPGARAGSAGVFLTLAAHVAAIASGSNIGAAHPVGIGIGAPSDESSENEKGEGVRSDQEIMAQKVENDTLAFVESIALARQRNVEWARRAVEKSESITADKALELDVVDLKVDTVEALLEQIDGRTVETTAGPYLLKTLNAVLEERPMSLRQRAMAILGNPNLVYILFLIGMLGLYVEMSHPGLLFPALIGAASLLLALTGLSILPYNLTGVLFLVVGGVCFVAELYVTSFGLLSLAGAGALILGAVFLFEAPPGLDDFAGLRVAVSPSVYLSAALLSLAFVLPIAYVVAKAQLVKPQSGVEGLIEQRGTARSPIDARGGRVFVHGELWQARSAEPIASGMPVIVRQVEGLTLWVEPAPNERGTH